MPTPHRPRRAAGLASIPLLALGLAAPAWAGLTVHFVEPEHYTDAAYTRMPGDERDRAAVQRDLEAHLEGLAARELQPGDDLLIEVLDIDLAGQIEPFALRSGREMRVVRGVSWPRLKLRYALTRGGQVVERGEERVADMSFQMSINRYPDGDRLRYEKAMLDDWFGRRFATR